MNERIEELAEQAERYADDNFKGEPFWTEAYESTFAELIVRECAKLVEDNIDPQNAWITPAYIKEHFGVEE